MTLSSLKEKYVNEVTGGTTDSFDLTPMETFDWCKENIPDLSILTALGFTLVDEDEFMYYQARFTHKTFFIDYILENMDNFFYTIQDLQGNTLCDMHPKITLLEFINWAHTGKFEM